MKFIINSCASSFGTITISLETLSVRSKGSSLRRTYTPVTAREEFAGIAELELGVAGWSSERKNLLSKYQAWYLREKEPLLPLVSWYIAGHDGGKIYFWTNYWTFYPPREATPSEPFY